MCVIIYRKDDTKRLDQYILEDSEQCNPDGMGLMFPHDGRVLTMKTMTGGAELYEAFKDAPSLAAHMRITTHGNTNLDMCHPFKIYKKGDHLLNGETADTDLYMMHNGILSDVDRHAKTNPISPYIKTNSDTWHFVRDYIRPILSQHPEMLFNEGFQQSLSLMASGSKLLFMNGHGDTVIINEDLGLDHEGHWFSNSMSLWGVHMYADKDYDDYGYNKSCYYMPKKFNKNAI